MDHPQTGQKLIEIYQRLFQAYGPQGWWPGEGPFEVMVGAILTQNTAWQNAERALKRLKAANALTPAALRNLSQEELQRLIRPAGYYRLKTRRLQALLAYLDRAHGGDPTALAKGDPERLRRELLDVRGIGPETADSILLYAGGHAAFVIDAYTRRLLGRLALAADDEEYQALRALFMDHLPPDPPLYNEYHALIVAHAKERCTKRDPRCGQCPLADLCAYESSR